MNTIRIIGIDPGIVITGFCILDFFKSTTRTMNLEPSEQQRKEALIESVLAEQSIAPLYTEIFRLYYAEPSTLKRDEIQC